MTKPHEMIAIAEAQRAIYLDFEGFQGAAPSLVGFRVGGRTVQLATDPLLVGSGATHVEACLPFGEAMQQLAERARAEDRRIVAWSEYELHATREFADIDLLPWYANARRVAERSFNRGDTWPRKPATWSLKDVEATLGIPRPAKAAAGQATAWLHLVLKGIARNGGYSAITPHAKSRWVRLLRYNALDVDNLEAVLRRVLAMTDAA